MEDWRAKTAASGREAVVDAYTNACDESNLPRASIDTGLCRLCQRPAPDRILLPASFLSIAVLRPPAATTHSAGLAPLPARTWQLWQACSCLANSRAPLTSVEASLA
jgi:hypothetical protein